VRRTSCRGTARCAPRPDPAPFRSSGICVKRASNQVLRLDRRLPTFEFGLKLLSSVFVCPRRHLVSACCARQRSCQLRFPSHGLRGSRCPKGTRPIRHSLFPVPCSLFFAPALRPLNPESRILAPAGHKRSAALGEKHFPGRADCPHR
jgi:hypothetical protein